jgi:two-component system cell cycle response regulator DivK
MAHILMIDDDLNFARLLEKVLSARGHTMTHAADAMTGLQLVENAGVDLVVLDIDLPDLDGKVVAMTLRARPRVRSIPIVAVTAQSDATTRRLVLAFGCDDFVSKPIDTRTFVTQLERHLTRVTP